MSTAMAADGMENRDVRVQRSKDKVLAATYELMSEGGLGGVSIDEVSRRCGVAKTTIYRHWPTRSALLLDVCARLGPRREAPDTGSLEGDLTALATFLAGQLSEARWPSILPSIIDAAEHDADIAELHRRLHARFSAPYEVVVERARKQGRVRRGAKASDAAALIMGPMFYRRWFSREPLDPPFVRAVVAGALTRLAARND